MTSGKLGRSYLCQKRGGGVGGGFPRALGMALQGSSRGVERSARFQQRIDGSRGFQQFGVRNAGTILIWLGWLTRRGAWHVSTPFLPVLPPPTYRLSWRLLQLFSVATKKPGAEKAEDLKGASCELGFANHEKYCQANYRKDLLVLINPCSLLFGLPI
jgi:hypothetical protein